MSRNAMTQKTATPERARRLYRILLFSGIAGAALYIASRLVLDDIPDHWLYDATCLTLIALVFMKAFYWLGRLEEALSR